MWSTLRVKQFIKKSNKFFFFGPLQISLDILRVKQFMFKGNSAVVLQKWICTRDVVYDIYLPWKQFKWPVQVIFS